MSRSSSRSSWGVAVLVGLSAVALVAPADAQDQEKTPALAPWAHGQGFATEAVRAVVAWGERHFGAQRTVCLIDPDNVASIRVAEKCGYRRVASSTYKGAPTLLFERAG